jgi:signal transduction histidine kinase
MKRFLQLKIIMVLFVTSHAFPQSFKQFVQKNKPSTPNLEYLSKLKVFEKKNSFSEQERIVYFQELAETFYELRSFDSTLHYANLGLNISKNTKNDSLIAMFYRFKGNCFYHFQDKEKARSFYKQGLRKIEGKNYTILEADLITNLAIIDIDAVKIEDAEQKLEKAITLFATQVDSLYSGFLQARYLLIACNKHTQKVKNVLPLCENLLISTRKSKHVKIHSGVLFFYSYCLVEQQQLAKAVDVLQEAYQVALSNQDLEVQRQALKEKALILAKIGKHEEAFKASQEALDLHSKILKNEVVKAASDAEVKYQTKEKEQEIKIKNILLDQEKKQKNLLIFIAFLVLILLLISFLFWRKNQRNKNVLILRKQKEESLKKIVETEENERIRIAKELHDGIVQDLTSVYLNMTSLDESNLEQKSKTISHLKGTIEEVRNLSHQMMPITLREKGLVLAMEDLFERSLTPLKIEFSFDSFGFDERLDAKIENSIYRIVQELLNNVIKHSQATEVNCVLRKTEKSVLLILEDNGIGISQQNSSKGIGLESLKSRLEYLNGTIDMSSEVEHSGLFTKIQIPLR